MKLHKNTIGAHLIKLCMVIGGFFLLLSPVFVLDGDEYTTKLFYSAFCLLFLISLFQLFFLKVSLELGLIFLSLVLCVAISGIFNKNDFLEIVKCLGLIFVYVSMMMLGKNYSIENSFIIYFFFFLFIISLMRLFWGTEDLNFNEILARRPYIKSSFLFLMGIYFLANFKANRIDHAILKNINLLLGLWLIFLMNSRTVQFASALILIMPLLQGLSIKKVFYCILTGVVIVFFLDTLLSFENIRFFNKNITEDVRFLIWISTFELYFDSFYSFIFGLGVSPSLYESGLYYIKIRSPHNSYIQAITQFGLLGLFSVFLVLFYIYKSTEAKFLNSLLFIFLVAVFPFNDLFFFPIYFSRGIDSAIVCLMIFVLSKKKLRVA